MRHLKYPIGIQSFQKIIEEGYAYVDKTSHIGSMVREGAYYFLSRPRRFGKSLLVSTMQAYFEGRKDLFRGLALDSMDVEWTASPVLHFDFNAENFTVEKGLEHLLDTMLYDYEEIYGRREIDATPAQRFRTLIRKAYEQTGRKVVILIDEYDKPLLGIEENHELFEKNQAVLKSFFANLKTMDSFIRFAFLTGVARFNKVSIFSDLNNLDDIPCPTNMPISADGLKKNSLNIFVKALRILRLTEENNTLPRSTHCAHITMGTGSATGAAGCIIPSVSCPRSKSNASSPTGSKQAHPLSSQNV